MYSINDLPFQADNYFDNLPSGEYELVVMDAAGCTNTSITQIEPYPFINFNGTDSIHPRCLLEDGSITILASGGFGSLTYSINDGPFGSNSTFDNLAPGNYIFSIRDENDCEVIDSLRLPVPLCPIYIPNIISDNGDGFNDEFILSVDPNYNVDILEYWIYDRWGELIFRSSNFNIMEFNTSGDTNKIWWDGQFKKQNAVEGVYSYLIEVLHENGTKGKLAGTVTLVR